MKRSNLIAVLVGFMAIVAFANNASAYYHAGMGRFLTRDPGPEVPTRVGSAGMAVGGHFVERDLMAEPANDLSRPARVVVDVISEAERLAGERGAVRFGGEHGSDRSLWPYADGMNVYEYVMSGPATGVDPSGLRKKRCGSVGCQCSEGGPVSGTEWVAFYSESSIAHINGPGGGCVTLPNNEIHCTMPCADIPKSRGEAYIPGDRTPRSILNHECCHICDLKKGLAKYLDGAVREPLGCSKNCDQRAKDAYYFFSDPQMPDAGKLRHIPAW